MICLRCEAKSRAPDSVFCPACRDAITSGRAPAAVAHDYSDFVGWLQQWRGKAIVFRGSLT